MPSPKLAIIGLDCADPHLVFDRWLDDLPNLKPELAGLIPRTFSMMARRPTTIRKD